jgi:E3 ubiquitin-protein ligase UBR1
MDDTCVFCRDCFFATEHTDHQVSFNLISHGGGCCDCGDPEAWRLPVACKLHPADDTAASSGNGLAEDFSSPLNAAIRQQEVEGRVEALLDYICCVAGGWYLTPNCEPLDICRVENLAETPEDLLIEMEANPIDGQSNNEENDGTPVEGELFSALLWNDELHSFQEVIEVVCDALQCSEEHADTIAHEVDDIVRV